MLKQVAYLNYFNNYCEIGFVKVHLMIKITVPCYHGSYRSDDLISIHIMVVASFVADCKLHIHIVNKHELY